MVVQLTDTPELEAGSRRLRERVREAYSRAASEPTEGHPFPVGRALAEDVGYPESLLDALPKVAVDAFAGVGAVASNAEIAEGATVLDLGCGAGVDTVIAARRTGPHGKVIGVDFSDSMLERARAAVAEAELTHVELMAAPAEALPLATASVDVALVNGIFNLNPARDAIFAELARVVRPDGILWIAELVLTGPLSEEAARDESNWFA
ncbi:MAG: methyltransferase domain-containing protein [Deltaproteobacteria bacterium]|nr:methyltransferase domain-containing protein [Deltaproteobacteria bacterium]